MNAKQAVKYELIKNALKAISFDWVDAPSYVRNGEVVYQSEGVFFKPDANTMYSLVTEAGGVGIALRRNDVRIGLGFLLEYNTDEKFVMEQAEKIHKAAKALTV